MEDPPESDRRASGQAAEHRKRRDTESARLSTRSLDEEQGTGHSQEEGQEAGELAACNQS